MYIWLYIWYKWLLIFHKCQIKMQEVLQWSQICSEAWLSSVIKVEFFFFFDLAKLVGILFDWLKNEYGKARRWL